MLKGAIDDCTGLLQHQVTGWITMEVCISLHGLPAYRSPREVLTHRNDVNRFIWWFPKSYRGTPSHHPFLAGIFPYKPTSYGSYGDPPWETTIFTAFHGRQCRSSRLSQVLNTRVSLGSGWHLDPQRPTCHNRIMTMIGYSRI